MAKSAIDSPLSQTYKTDSSSHTYTPWLFSSVKCVVFHVNIKLGKGQFHHQHLDSKFGNIMQDLRFSQWWL
jgi:hypothetical protein